ncbi:MAG: hypothetical protein F7C32_03690 [Desulfurococcales archaeon]|nr:hypothetical protein [Desulfurococcales archaeon]
MSVESGSERLVNTILGELRNRLLSITDSISGLGVILEGLDALLDNMLKGAIPSSYEETKEVMEVFFHAVRVLVPFLGSVSTLADIVEEAYSRVERSGDFSKWIYISLAKQASAHLRELHEMMFRSLGSRCSEVIDGSNLVVTAIGFSEENIACLSSISDRIYEVVVPIDEVMRTGIRLRDQVRRVAPELSRKIRLTVDSTTLYMVRHSHYLVSSTMLVRPDGVAVVPVLSYLPLRAAGRFGVNVVIPTYTWNLIPDNRDYNPLPKRRYVMGQELKDMLVPLLEAVKLDDNMVLITEEEAFRWGSLDVKKIAEEFRRKAVNNILRVGYET